MSKKRYWLGLCDGRHQLPDVDGFVFNEVNNPMDFGELMRTAEQSIPVDAEMIDLYVTGFTPATLAVVKVCANRSINLNCWHFDRESGEYKPQAIFSGFETCGCCGSRKHWGTLCPHCGG